MLARLIFALLLMGSAASQAAEPVRIGVLTDFSGNFAAVSGPGSLIATQMAVEDFGGSVLGRPIQILQADHKNRPDLALSIAREWYDSGVDAMDECAEREEIETAGSGDCEAEFHDAVPLG